MKNDAESVYPDLLRTGLARLSAVSSHRELLTLFAALDYFRRDLHAQDDLEGVLELTQRYILGLDLFATSGFFVVNASDFGFDLLRCEPGSASSALDRVAREQIRAGRFAAALRESSFVFFDTGPEEARERGVLHKLAVPREVQGMFCGVLSRTTPAGNEIAFSLLSMLLGACADAQATMKKTDRLRLEIKTLGGLVPICAWCRKIRDDRGYWEQIEDFLRSHSGASCSHGICPDCQKKFLEDLPPAAP